MNTTSGRRPKTLRTRQIAVKLSESEWQAIWAAFVAQRVLEPTLTLAAWIRRKGAEGPK